MSGRFQRNLLFREHPELPPRMARLEDRYEFLGLLGEGGAGTVFQVRNRALQRLEALKLLTGAGHPPDDAQRFVHEATTAAALDHPHIVRIHAFGQDDGVLWYSMQLMEGPTLAAILDAGQILDATALVRLALPVLDALSFSHARGVIHRDIKPANLLFSREGRPFLADFGIAKSRESALVTRTGQFLGTPAYVAPEQAMGEAVDARADLYALGVTLYRAATGRLPFQSDTPMQALILRFQEPPTPLADLRPGLDPALAALIMRAMARHREDRFPDAEAMREACLQAAAAAGIAWDQPLEQARAFPPAPLRPPPTRTGPLPLPPRPAADPMDPTADLAPARPRLASGTVTALAVAALAAGILAMVLGPRPHRRAASAAGPLTAARPVNLPADRSVSLPDARSVPFQADRPASLPDARSVPLPAERSAPLPDARPVPLPAGRPASLPDARSVPFQADRAASLPDARSVPLPATRRPDARVLARTGPAGRAVPDASAALAGERRPVVYPQLLDTPAGPAGPLGCAGLSVAVSLLVGEDGRVQRCRILTPVQPDCAAAARAMALNFRFKPALDAQGRPVQTTLAAAVDFPEAP